MRQLAPDRVEALFREFDAGRSIRRAAAAVGTARRTAGRYHSIWRSDAKMGRIVIDIGSGAGRGLGEEARLRRISMAELAGLILEEVAESRLCGALLGEVDRR